MKVRAAQHTHQNDLYWTRALGRRGRKWDTGRGCFSMACSESVGGCPNSGVRQASGVFKVLQLTPMCYQAKRPPPGHCCGPAALITAYRELLGPLGPHWVRICISSSCLGCGLHSVLKIPLDCMAVNSFRNTESPRAPKPAAQVSGNHPHG